MKTIKFLLMGNKNVGKSTLLDTYLWKLKYGMAYHDHISEEIRYIIDVIEIETVEELRSHLTEHIEMKNIYFVCFNVNDRKTLHTARNEWILQLLQHNPKTRIFLVGLQCDLRDQILTKLKQDCVSHSDGVTISRYYENVQYLECSSNRLDSVENLFDKAIKIRCDCENVCEECE
ncbi:cell division control protein 42 homolog [Lucilia cuprina]|uniref:cell division control protein 42 homolog n=1 Tax=Lucilia cuprina TaxID=7375 RepID=UPI001F051945|nr:cell division control protein 42 homolog [Lucilia cuprina]